MEFYIPVTPTRPKPPLVWLLFLKKSGTGDNNFVKWELAHSGLIDNKKRTGQSGPPSKVVPNIAVGPNRNGLFHLISIRNFRNFGLNGKRGHVSRVGSRYAFQKSELIDQISPFENKVTVIFFKIFLNSNTADLNVYKQLWYLLDSRS